MLFIGLNWFFVYFVPSMLNLLIGLCLSWRVSDVVCYICQRHDKNNFAWRKQPTITSSVSVNVLMTMFMIRITISLRYSFRFSLLFFNLRFWSLIGSIFNFIGVFLIFFGALRLVFLLIPRNFHSRFWATILWSSTKHFSMK